MPALRVGETCLVFFFRHFQLNSVQSNNKIENDLCCCISWIESMTNVVRYFNDNNLFVCTLNTHNLYAQ